MKPPPFEYFAPSTVPEAVHLLDSSENAKLLAGGQSLMAMLNMRFIFPDQIIDLNGIEGIGDIFEEDGSVTIGAMTRQRTLLQSPLIRRHLPAIPKAIAHVGHLQTRNRGTIGGSLCQLDPSAELPALAMAYGAIVEVRGPNGARQIAFEDFPVFYMTPAVEPNELLTAVRFKPWVGRAGSGFSEFSRRHGDFAIAGAIALLELAANDTITRASLTVFGVANAPVRASSAETLLIGQRPDAELFQQASMLCRDLASLEDPYGSAHYRGHVAALMAERALTEAAAEASLFSKDKA